MNEVVLSVRDLAIEFDTSQGVMRAVDGVSFDLRRGETLGLVGESGCGKTVTALSLLGLVPKPPGRIAGGQILYGGEDLATWEESRWRSLRGRRISMIFQEPMTALNPVFTVGNQMLEVLLRHTQLRKREARQRAAEMLTQVGIADASACLNRYPHELSGGMRQRVMIAMALSCDPDVLIADEPTTALDVTTQAQVMEQIVALQARLGTTVILITHDLGVVAESCQQAVVMYCGRVAEAASVADLYSQPRHPYTEGLLASVPRIRERRLERLPAIDGRVPDLASLPRGCRFEPRCSRKIARCALEQPPLQAGVEATDHATACWNPVPGS